MQSDLETQIDALREEVAQLRRRNRVGWGVAVLCVVGIGLVGAGRPLQVLRTDRIEVRRADTNPTQTQGVVIEHAGEEGPTITLTDGEGRVGRLTLAGLELFTHVAEPDKVPTLEDPGIGEEAPDPDTIKTRFNVDGAYVTHVTVSCTPGYRARARFVDGTATLAIPTGMSTCQAVFGGGSVASRVSITPGGEVACRNMSGTSSTLHCEQSGD